MTTKINLTATGSSCPGYRQWEEGVRLGKVPTSRKRMGARERVAYVRPRLSAAYTRSSRSGCGTLGAGCATANILDTRESAGAFRGGPGGLKAGKLLKKRRHSERVKKESPKPSLHTQLQPSLTLLIPIRPPSAAYLGPRSWLPRTPAKDWLLLTRALSRRRCGRTDRDIME